MILNWPIFISYTLKSSNLPLTQRRLLLSSPRQLQPSGSNQQQSTYGGELVGTRSGTNLSLISFFNFNISSTS